MDIPWKIRILAALPHDATIVRVSKEPINDIDVKLINRFGLDNVSEARKDNILLQISKGQVSISCGKQKSGYRLNNIHPMEVLSLLRLLWQLQTLRMNRRVWDQAFDFRKIIIADRVVIHKGSYIPQDSQAYRNTVPGGRIFGPQKEYAPVRQWKALDLELCYRLPPGLNFGRLLFARLAIPSIYRDTGLTVYGRKGAQVRVYLQGGAGIGRGICNATVNFKAIAGDFVHWMIDASYEGGLEADDPWIELNKERLVDYAGKIPGERNLKLRIRTNGGVMINAASFDLELFGYPGFIQARK